jgi:pimeloyl-ACP methyl ester carboxylesterase
MVEPVRARRTMPMPSPWRRRALVALGVFMVLVALTYAGASVAMANQLTLGNHLPLSQPGSAVETPFRDVTFPSRIDHITLRGWLFRSPVPSGRSAIVLHGFHQNRVNADFNAIGLARNLLLHGYDVLLFDLRSCGQSGGDRFTLGTLEPRDLLGAYDFMRRQGYVPQRMAIMGDSEGGAIVIEAAAELRAVGALVADSAFAELRPLLDRELPSHTSLPPIVYPGAFLAGRLFGLNPDLRPVDMVRDLPERAFLFIEGAADVYVPPANAVDLRNASANRESVLLMVPKAGHVKSYQTDPTLYLSTLYRFLDQQIPEHGG